jgi:hypothetical protein
MATLNVVCFICIKLYSFAAVNELVAIDLLNVKKRYRFKKATLYELEVLKKQICFLRW